MRTHRHSVTLVALTVAVAIAAVTFFVALFVPATASAGKIVADFFPDDGVSGTLGGRFDFGVRSGGVAVWDSTGQIYVADTDNARIQCLFADGVFRRGLGSAGVFRGSGSS